MVVLLNNLKDVNDLNCPNKQMISLGVYENAKNVNSYLAIKL